MTPYPSSPPHIFFLKLLLFFLLSTEKWVESTTFTLVNNCGDTIWPGILSNSGSPPLESTGFVLSTGTSRSLLAPTGWSGRFWARTACSFDNSNRILCATGDCGSGAFECGGAAATPPATLAEFTLSAAGGNDFYDVSLVDGYNLPVVVVSSGGVGGCAPTGCAVDLNQQCPAELKVEEGAACRSACEAFGKPEYCCSGEFASPAACRPSVYSELFKSACPRSYSYAYDDASSTFTCAGADYSITFCPESTPSQKSTRAYSSPPNTPATKVVEGDSWLVSLAMGGTGTASSSRKDSTVEVATAVSALVCVLLL